MAGSLFGIGYSFAIPFDWAAASRVPLPGMATQAGENLADLVVSRVENFLTTQGVQPNDSIDLHFIGHSRGAVVISSALQVLEETEQSGGLLPQLAGGYVKMTMLDPHPAHNHLLPLFSSVVSDIFLPEVVTAFGWLAATGVIAFQAAAQDPEVVVPANVNEAEVYFQHTNSLSLLFTNWEEAILNLWGEVPVVGTDHCYNLTGPGIGHGEVPDWYQQHVIPTLGLAPVAPLTAGTRMLSSVQGGMSAAAANAPAMESTPSARGEHLSEDFLFPAAVDTPGILHSLGSKLAAAQTAALQGNIRAEENILQAFLHELSAQRARHITIAAADFLAALTQLALEGIHQSGLASSAQNSRSDSPGVSRDTPTSLAQKLFLAPAGTPPANRASDNSGLQLQTGRPDEESLVPIEVGLFAGDLLPVRERPAPGNRR
jgi:hypothetical protein